MAWVSVLQNDCTMTWSDHHFYLKVLRACVYQMPYVQSIAVFLLVALNISGITYIGDLSPAKPFLYLMVLSMVSFFTGIWALFSLFGITTSYSTLSQFKYNWKSAIFKVQRQFLSAPRQTNSDTAVTKIHPLSDTKIWTSLNTQFNKLSKDFQLWCLDITFADGCDLDKRAGFHHWLNGQLRDHPLPGSLHQQQGNGHCH